MDKTKKLCDIHSDEEFQERYGLSDIQMAALKATWYQVDLPIIVLKCAVIAGAMVGFLIAVIYLTLKL